MSDIYYDVSDVEHDCLPPGVDADVPDRTVAFWDCPECGRNWRYDVRLSGGTILDNDWFPRGKPSRKWRKAMRRKFASRS